MRPHSLAALGAAFSVVAAVAAAAPAADVTGNWVTEDRTALVRIADCGRQLCGTVVRILAGGPRVPTTDVNNPNPRLRTHPLVGLRVLSGFGRGNGRWEGGRAYDAKTGTSYRARLELNPTRTLKVTGCVLFVCRSQVWTRAPG
jgi:uncharacterized protein (DUF2147 family)